MQNALGPETKAILIHQRKDAVVIWAIGNRTSEVFTVGSSQEESQRTAGMARRDIREGRPSESGSRLRSLLLDAALADLDSGSTVIVVADPPFAGFPWSALPDGAGQPLVRRWSFVSSPSLSAALLHDREIEPARTVFAVGAPEADGLPPLPAVRDEINQVAGLYPQREVLLGRDANPRGPPRVGEPSPAPSRSRALELEIEALQTAGGEGGDVCS